MGFIFYVEKGFENIPWRDRNAATGQINRGKEIIYANPSIASLQPIVNDLWDNGRFNEKREGDHEGPNVPKGSILRG